MGKTTRIAVVSFRRATGLDEYEETRRVWLATLGSLIVPLPNFKWRRDIIATHDAHHLITRYPTSARGELCLAAWELGIECYGDWRARALCGFLMALGLLSQPKKTISAFRDGCRLAPVYLAHGNQGVLDLELSDARKIFGVEA